MKTVYFSPLPAVHKMWLDEHTI